MAAMIPRQKPMAAAPSTVPQGDPTTTRALGDHATWTSFSISIGVTPAVWAPC
jgi:hypothetical protein